MPIGTVIFCLETKAFGFIKPESGDKDIFFHRSHVAQSDIDAVRRGSRVQFEVDKAPNGKSQALHVQIIKQQEVKATDDGSQALAWQHSKSETT